MSSFYLCLCILCSGKKAIHESMTGDVLKFFLGFKMKKKQNRISFHSFTYHSSSKACKAPEWMLPSVTSMGPDMVHSLHAGFMVASVAYAYMLDTAALKYEIGLVKFGRSSVTGPAQIPGRAHLESRNGIAWVWVCSIIFQRVVTMATIRIEWLQISADGLQICLQWRVFRNYQASPGQSSK